MDVLSLPTGRLRGLDRAMLRIIADEGNRAVLAVVVETAERALWLDSAYVRELARWAPPPGSTRRDGAPHTAYPARSERIRPTVIQTAVSVRRPPASVLFASGGEHLGISHG